MGIGATDNAVIGLFEVKTKQYHTTILTGDHEIAPLYGNITMMDGEVYLHLHINLCDATHRCFGGHLTSAVVSATFEGVIDVMEGAVDRVHDDDLGLNLLDL